MATYLHYYSYTIINSKKRMFYSYSLTGESNLLNCGLLTDILYFLQVGIYLPCYDIFRDWIEGFTNQNYPTMTPYAPLVAGSLARSLACITCYPIELARTHMQVLVLFSSWFFIKYYIIQ